MCLLGAGLVYLLVQGRSWFQERRESMQMASAISRGAFAEVGIPTACTNKSYCVVTYVAPWCGVCKSNEPTFQALQKFLSTNRTDVGFGLVIGGASSEENLKMKKDLSGVESYTDDNGKLLKMRDIRVFPTWVVLDSKGNEINRQPGGFVVTEEAGLRQLVNQLTTKK